MTRAEWLRREKGRIDALDARLLLQHVTGCTHAQLIVAADAALSAAECARLEELAGRRAAGEPLAYLVESAGFYGRTWRITPAVLTPRPETEELVSLALAKLAAFLAAGEQAPRALDLGTGSGAIAVTLALECLAAEVTAVDVSPEALAVARDNAVRLGAKVVFYRGDWFSALPQGETFQLIVANPPYLAADDPHLAGDGVAFEPRLALTDEADGLSDLAQIVAGAPKFLSPGGWLLCEHGNAQGAAMRRLLSASGFFREVATWKDGAGHERISGGRACGG